MELKREDSGLLRGSRRTEIVFEGERFSEVANNTNAPEEVVSPLMFPKSVRRLRKTLAGEKPKILHLDTPVFILT